MMGCVNKKNVQIHLSDIWQMNDTVGLLHHDNNRDPDTLVMRGHCNYRRHKGGLSVHCIRAVELQNISNAVELPPGISFNLIFEGAINISLGGNQYQLGSHNIDGVECSSIVLVQPEVLTRHMKKGMHVHKVNLFVERDWLESRCQNQVEEEQLAKIFHQHAEFRNWTLSQNTEHLAGQFIKQTSEDNSLSGQLELEHMTIQLLSAVINELLHQVNNSDSTSRTLSLNNIRHQQLKHRIDATLQEYRSLNEIATSMGISTSTLQRKFKASYGMTVIDYIRQRRLEIARAALTVQGLSIGEAAYLAGYNHPSNFVTAFKKRFSITPAALVKTHRRR
ncbi:MAG: helix-turn-helix domain-containing protein, partial [Gammaproteobacteria bacterium]